MGDYLEHTSKGVRLPGKGKAEALIKAGDAKLYNGKLEFDEIPDDKVLVVVVCNGSWDAAACAFEESELLRFLRGMWGREHSFLLVDKAYAKKETGV